MDFPEGFEWDPEKARINHSKHGVVFENIIRLFDSPFIEDYDQHHSEFEDRYQVLGLCDGTVYCVVLTFRGEVRRLIGARRATPVEARLFHARLFGDPIL